MEIFDSQGIIPKFCFGCYKVQVEVKTIVDLILLTALFYRLNFDDDLSRKTMVETRPDIPGYYKGLIYCQGLTQAKEVKALLDGQLSEIFGNRVSATVKRGCSEYSKEFPEYARIGHKTTDTWKFPYDWESVERNFDREKLMLPKRQLSSSSDFSLSDFFVIENWIDYAKGIADKTALPFNVKSYGTSDIYETARKRINQ